MLASRARVIEKEIRAKECGKAFWDCFRALVAADREWRSAHRQCVAEQLTLKRATTVLRRKVDEEDA